MHAHAGDKSEIALEVGRRDPETRAGGGRQASLTGCNIAQISSVFSYLNNLSRLQTTVIANLFVGRHHTTFA
jgi:hypothetical protein